MTHTHTLELYLSYPVCSTNVRLVLFDLMSPVALAAAVTPDNYHHGGTLTHTHSISDHQVIVCNKYSTSSS